MRDFVICQAKRTIKLLLAFLMIITIASISIPETTAYTSYGYSNTRYSNYGVNGQYGFQPRMPVLIGNEVRPEGYGLVRQGPPYPSTWRTWENNNFLGHRSSWDGRTAYYSGINSRLRTNPRYRTVNPQYNPTYPNTYYARARLYPGMGSYYN